MAALPFAASPAPAQSFQVKPDRELMVPVEGGNLYVRVNGDLNSKRPPLVYLHGGPGSGHAGLLPLTALADERAIILYDQLDSGRSDAPQDPANWRVSRFVDEIDAVRRALGVEHWHLGGGSWGGTLALEYGARRPAALQSLIVQSPLVSTRSWIADADRLRGEMPIQWQATLLACESTAKPVADQCEWATDAYYRSHVYRSDGDPAIAAYRQGWPRDSGDAVYAGMWGSSEFSASGTLAGYDGEPLLAKLDGPDTLFVAGEYDEARPETVAGFTRRVPGAEFQMIAGAAHAILRDAPDIYLALLRRWLADHDPAGAP